MRMITLSFIAILLVSTANIQESFGADAFKNRVTNWMQRSQEIAKSFQERFGQFKTFTTSAFKSVTGSASRFTSNFSSMFSSQTRSMFEKMRDTFGTLRSFGQSTSLRQLNKPNVYAVTFPGVTVSSRIPTFENIGASYRPRNPRMPGRLKGFSPSRRTRYYAGSDLPFTLFEQQEMTLPDPRQ